MTLHRVLRPIGALVCCTLFSISGESEARAADPPKTIIEIGTSPLCTTLRESIVPVLVGLQANDALIDEGHQQLDQWTHDYWIEGGRGAIWRMDRLRVENVVSSLVRNLNVLDGILNDPQRFPRDKLNSSATTVALHDQLQAVEDGQRKTLNDLYGPVDDSMMTDMMQLPSQTIQTKAFSAVPAKVDGNNTMDAPAVSSNSPPQVSPANKSFPTPQAASLDAQQLRLAKLESNAANVVNRAVDQCKDAVAPKPKS